MIDLYYWTTPNGHKISIFLEEAGLDYTLHPVDIGRGEQFDPAFLAIAPNNRIPAIKDPDGPDGAPITVFDKPTGEHFALGAFARADLAEKTDHIGVRGEPVVVEALNPHPFRDLERPRESAERLVTFQNSYRETGFREIVRRHKAGEPAADHDYSFGIH